MANTKITSRVIADNSVGIDALNVTDGTNGQQMEVEHYHLMMQQVLLMILQM